MSKGTDAAYFTIARNWVVEAVDYVTSADAFFAELQGTPSYVPRRIVREVWREYGKQTAWAAFVERRAEEKPLLRRFFHNIPSTAEEAYNVKVRLSGLDPATGEEVEAFWTVGFDYAPSKGEIMALALSDPYYMPAGVDAEAVSVGLEYMYHVEGKPW